MPFNEQPPKWLAPGVEPSESKKAEGWLPNERPPADYWNWQMYRVYQVLLELQAKAIESDSLAALVEALFGDNPIFPNGLMIGEDPDLGRLYFQEGQFTIFHPTNLRLESDGISFVTPQGVVSFYGYRFDVNVPLEGMNLDGDLNVTGNIISNGNVAGNSVTSNNSPVSTVRARAKEILIGTTSETTVATHTSSLGGNFLVGIYLRVLVGTTNITVKVTYTDLTGAQTTTIINAQPTTVGSYSLVPCYINAGVASPIAVKVTASVASRVRVSASIMEV